MPHESPGDDNVARLLQHSYRPEQPAPEFRARVANALLGRVTPAMPRLRAGLIAASAIAATLLIALIWPRAHSPLGTTVAAAPPQPGLAPRPRPAIPITEPFALGQTVTTGPREPKRLRCPDGTVLYLKAGTTATLTADRTVRLDAGELFAEVSPRTSGPTFTVRAPSRTVEALGTKFGVQATGRVLVTQGQVRSAGTLIRHGQELATNASQPQPARQPAADLDWTRELMEQSQTPLVPAKSHAGGELIAVDPNGQETKLTQRRYHVDVHIEDGFARTTIDQTYFNETTGRLEGMFYFPLPPDASLSRLAMYVDGTRMEGGMAERDHARNVYETILYQRRDPALLEWLDGSTFKMRVFPLEPRQEKRLVLSYTQRVPVLDGRPTYRFPAAQNTTAQWSTTLRVVGGAGWGWNSPSHELGASTAGNDLILGATGQHVHAKADLVVDLQPPTPAATQFTTCTADGWQYLMLRHRPTLTATPNRQRRDWVFLVETSADRNPLLTRAQIEAVRGLLDHAEHDDTFRILAAGTRSRFLAEEALPATAANIDMAMNWLGATHLVGALDLDAALTKACDALANSKEPWLAHVGSGTPALGEADATKLVAKLEGKCHYVGIGIGQRWNRAFMRQAAERTAGLCTQINPDESVAWRTFTLAGALNGSRVQAMSVGDAAHRFLLCDTALTPGEELCAVARIPVGQPLPQTLTVRGQLDGQPLEVALPVSGVRDGAGYLPRTWAKLEIDRLLAEDAVKHKEAITALSKSMYVMSPYTSLLVLENEAMYEQFKVDRGRKDHWAAYACPDKVSVGADPLPAVRGPFAPTASDVLSGLTVRVPVCPLTVINEGGAEPGKPANAWDASQRLHYRFAYAEGKKDTDSPVKNYFTFGDMDASTVLGNRPFARVDDLGELGVEAIAGNNAFDHSRFIAGLQPDGAFTRRGTSPQSDPIKDAEVNLFGRIQPADVAGRRVTTGLAGGGFGGGRFGGSGFGGANFGGRGAGREPLRIVNGATTFFGDAVRLKTVANPSDPDGIESFGITLGNGLGWQWQENNAVVMPGLVAGNAGTNGIDVLARQRRFGEPSTNEFSERGWAMRGDTPPQLNKLPYVNRLFRQRGEAEVFRHSKFGRLSSDGDLRYRVPTYHADGRLFSDLLAYAPGMNTLPADMAAALETGSPVGRAVTGRIDPAARVLIDRARGRGWERVRFGDSPALLVDGRGRYAITRPAREGLVEQIVCDGESLWHLYGEIGVGAVRRVSRFHRAELAARLPWLVPPVEDLAQGCHVRVGEANEVICEPVTHPGDRPAWRLSLRFDAAGDLIARRIHRLPEPKEGLQAQPLVASWEIHGGEVVISGEGSKPATLTWTREPAEAPNLKPDVAKLVVVPLPFRTPAEAKRALGERQNVAATDLTTAELMPLFAAHCAAGEHDKALTIYRQALEPRGERKIGYFTLLAAGGANLDGDNGNVLAHVPGDPLGQYLAVSTSPVLQKHALGLIRLDASGLVGRLVTFRTLMHVWESGSAERGGSEAERLAWKAVEAFAAGDRQSLLGWALVQSVHEQRKKAHGIGPDRAADLKAQSAALATFADVPVLSYAARYEAAAALRHNDRPASVPAFAALVRDTLAAGALPPFDTRLPDGLRDGANDQFPVLLREAAAALVKDGHRLAVIQLAEQAHQVGASALADHLHGVAVEGIADKGERLVVTLAVVQALATRDQPARADDRLQPLLTDTGVNSDPYLWRLASELAGRRGQGQKAIHCLEEALDREYADLPEVIDLQAVRRDYGRLLDHYAEVAKGIGALELPAPPTFAARVIRAADRWRAVDPEVQAVCDKAAGIFQTLRAKELAWDYLTTPLASRPGEAGPWKALAVGLAQRGEADLADEAYAAACRADATDAQLVWDRAQLLRQRKQFSAARPLLERLAHATWQPRFAWLQGEARRQLAE